MVGARIDVDVRGASGATRQAVAQRRNEIAAEHLIVPRMNPLDRTFDLSGERDCILGLLRPARRANRGMIRDTCPDATISSRQNQRQSPTEAPSGDADARQ